jgi:hypothetical protein
MKLQQVGENSIMKSFITCIIRMIKSRRMRWEGRVVRISEKRNAYRTLGESQKERAR